MKKVFSIIGIALGIALAIVFMTSSGQVDDARYKAEQAQKASAQAASESVPIPVVSYFQEKRTIAKWAQRWDKPSIATYVYLVSFGTVIGYYVADGKPASTRSYLMPEESAHGGGSAGYYTETNPDIDGTWGENNPGIRFFTAEGTAVEWAGSGASYIYSDAPLPINVPRLNTKPAK
jgi:hypothetical protein